MTATLHGSRARHGHHWRVLRVLATLLLLGPLGALSARCADLTVFAAASLTDALQGVVEAHPPPLDADSKIRFSFAASSTLARQIEAGAPADLYCSASEEWMDYLQSRGHLQAGSRVDLLGNELVLIAPAHADAATAAAGPVETVATPDNIDALLSVLGDDGRLAVGDPAHVPAGRYAMRALQALDRWETLQSRLARADNVRSALALVARGEAPLGIVYRTDAAITAQVRVLARIDPRRLSAAGGEPTRLAIRYPCALIAGRGGESARRFLAHLRGPEATAIFRRFGFTTP